MPSVALSREWGPTRILSAEPSKNQGLGRAPIAASCVCRLFPRAAIDHRPGETVEADEGRMVLRQHYARERNRSLVRLKRTDFASRNNGRVFCEICQFEYGEQYPRHLGDGFIEVHHLQPLSRSSDQRQTSLTDLLLVCANCHRMIHRTQDVEGNLAALQQHFAARH